MIAGTTNYLWSGNPLSDGTIVSPGNRVTDITFSNLGVFPRTYTLTLSETVGTCVSSDVQSIEIRDVPTPDIIANPNDPNVCENNSVNYSTTNIATHNYVWTLPDAGGTISGSGSSITVNWTGTGSRRVRVEEWNGAVGSSPMGFDEYNLFVATAPTWNLIIPPAGNICAGGQVTFSATTNGGAGGTVTWIRSATSGGAGIPVSSPDSPGVGIYYYRPQYSTTATGCTLADGTETAVTVNAVPAAPTAGVITQPTCALATGSVSLSGLPAGNWTINPGAIAGNTATTTISGLAPATYNYTVTNASGCTSLPSANVVINAQPATPASPTIGAGAITQPTCAVATGSVTLSGLPAGNWTINPGAIAGNTATTTISGLTPGTYNYTVTNASGCTSLPSANVVINAQPATPASPTVGAGAITQPTCAVPTGSVTLSGLRQETGQSIPEPSLAIRQHNNIRSCTSHLQLYRDQCFRLYFASFGKCCDQCPAGHPGITHNRSGSYNPADMSYSHRQCNLKRTSGRKLDDQPRSHRWQHGNPYHIRSCTSHLQLYRN